MMRGIVAAVSVLLGVLAAGCGQAAPPAAPPPTSSTTSPHAASTASAPAPPVRIDSACSVLTTRQVRRALDTGPVHAEASQAASAGVTRCRYTAGDAPVLTTRVVTGYTRQGRQAVRAFAAQRAEPGTITPVPQIARPAVSYRVGEQNLGAAVAFPAGDGQVTVVSVEGLESRDTLARLARRIPDNVAARG